MHGAPEFTALFAWYWSCSLASVLYIFIGRKPFSSRLVATFAAALVACLLLLALSSLPFGTGWRRGLVFLTFFSVPPLAWALAWLMFRRNRASP